MHVSSLTLVGCGGRAAPVVTPDTQATVKAAIAATSTAQAGTQATIDTAVEATTMAQTSTQATTDAAVQATTAAQASVQATADAAVQANASTSLNAQVGPQLQQLSGSINDITAQLARGQTPQAQANLGNLETFLGSLPSKPSRP